MADTPEGKIKRKLDKMLVEEGVYVDKPQAGPYGKSGTPDRILCVCGLYVGVEAKADATKKPTALQLKAARDIRANGGVWFLVYDDATINIVREFIRACRRRQTDPDPQGQRH